MQVDGQRVDAPVQTSVVRADGNTNDFALPVLELYPLVQGTPVILARLFLDEGPVDRVVQGAHDMIALWIQPPPKVHRVETGMVNETHRGVQRRGVRSEVQGMRCSRIGPVNPNPDHEQHGDDE